MDKKEKVSGKALKRILFIIILAYVILFIGPMISFYFYFLALLLVAIDIVLIIDISRCPNCGRFIHLNMFFKARKDIVYCYKCGEIIEVDEDN